MMEMAEKEKIIHEIAEEFVKIHNPNNWNGIGEPNKDFSEELEVYDIFKDDVYMVILFEMYEGEWLHFVKLYRKSDDQLIDGYHGYGVDSSQNLEDTICDICMEYDIK